MVVRAPDKEKISSKLDVIQSHRVLLDDFVEMSFEDFTSDTPDFAVKYDACLYRLQVALQAVLDVTQYLASCTSDLVYKENKDAFDILAHEKIISKELAERFKTAIGVRNILVHQYEQVEPEIIYNIIKNDLGDFDKFVDEVSAYLSL